MTLYKTEFDRLYEELSILHEDSEDQDRRSGGTIADNVKKKFLGIEFSKDYDYAWDPKAKLDALSSAFGLKHQVRIQNSITALKTNRIADTPFGWHAFDDLVANEETVKSGLYAIRRTITYEGEQPWYQYYIGKGAGSKGCYTRLLAHIKAPVNKSDSRALHYVIQKDKAGTPANAVVEWHYTLIAERIESGNILDQVNALEAKYIGTSHAASNDTCSPLYHLFDFNLCLGGEGGRAIQIGADAASRHAQYRTWLAILLDLYLSGTRDHVEDAWNLGDNTLAAWNYLSLAELRYMVEVLLDYDNKLEVPQLHDALNQILLMFSRQEGTHFVFPKTLNKKPVSPQVLKDFVQCLADVLKGDLEAITADPITRKQPTPSYKKSLSTADTKFFNYLFLSLAGMRRTRPSVIRELWSLLDLTGATKSEISVVAAENTCLFSTDVNAHKEFYKTFFAKERFSNLSAQPDFRAYFEEYLTTYKQKTPGKYDKLLQDLQKNNTNSKVLKDFIFEWILSNKVLTVTLAPAIFYLGYRQQIVTDCLARMPLINSIDTPKDDSMQEAREFEPKFFKKSADQMRKQPGYSFDDSEKLDAVLQSLGTEIGKQKDFIKLVLMLTPQKAKEFVINSYEAEYEALNNLPVECYQRFIDIIQSLTKE